MNGRKQGFFSCLAAALLFLYIIFQMTIFNSVSGHLQSDLGLSAVALGNLSSLYFYGAALSMLPYGILLDYYPSRWPGVLILLACVLATLLFAGMPSVFSAGLYRVVCGLTNPMVFLICMRQAPMWFPRKISMTIGWMITVGMLGGVLQYPFSLLMGATSWHAALWVDVCLGAVILIFAYCFLHDQAAAQRAPSKWQDIFVHLKAVMLRKNNWLCGIYTGCLNLPVLVLGALWGDHYLMQTQSLSQDQASFVVSMIFLGMIPASPFFGWFGQACRSYRQAMIVGALLSIAAVMLIAMTRHPHLLYLAILFFMLGFMCTAQIISYAVVNEVNPILQSSTAMSLVSMIIYAIGGLANPIFGGVESLFSAHTAFLLLPLAFTFSLIVSFFSKTTHC